MSIATDHWIAREPDHLPDFIIAGAMKSATTSLHHMLNMHPDVFIPEGEIGFFDIDDIFQHPDFNFFDGHKWYSQDMAKHPEALWQWYASYFEESKEGQLKGEDSTTYIVSEIAAKRIALQKKEIKLIVMLRQPTMRAYSQYWHMLRTGRATFSFEDTIKYHPESVLKRSMYLEQLQQWLKYLPREQIEIIIFEEFLKDKEGQLKKVCSHIGLDYEKLPANVFEIQKNTARIAAFPALNAFKNRIFRAFGNNRYRSVLPVAPPTSKNYGAWFSKLVSGVHLVINPLVRKKKPPIHAATKAFLDSYFKKELEGISDIVGKDVMSIWFE